MATTSKKKTDSASNRSKPAEVRMTVTRFKDVLAADRTGSCRDTGYTMALRTKHPRVFIKGDIIYVSSPGAVIRFTLVSTSSDKTKYYPVGITFIRKDRKEVSEAQRLGLLNFPQRQTRAERQNLSITARFSAKDRGSLFKFSILVQRGSDGKIGIIDPGIGHNSSDIRPR